MSLRALLTRHWPARHHPQPRGTEISVVVRFNEPRRFVEPLDWRDLIRSWNGGHLGTTS